MIISAGHANFGNCCNNGISQIGKSPKSNRMLIEDSERFLFFTLARLIHWTSNIALNINYEQIESELTLIEIKTLHDSAIAFEKTLINNHP